MTLQDLIQQAEEKGKGVMVDVPAELVPEKMPVWVDEAGTPVGYKRSQVKDFTGNMYHIGVAYFAHGQSYPNGITTITKA